MPGARRSLPLCVDPAVLDAYPDYRACVLVARGLRRVDAEGSERLRHQATEAARARFSDRPIADDPHIRAWRQAYSRFGSKPSRYPCSLEALVRRALKDELPTVSWIVDLYNYVSVWHGLPIGGEDADAVAGDLTLTFARGGEPFQTLSQGTCGAESADSGEVIWRDDLGITCRRWNWRQGARTCLRDDTANAFFVLDALAPYGDETLQGAAASLRGELLRMSPDTSIETFELRLGSA